MSRHSRQSFLGSETPLRTARIAIVGLGGGGSHVSKNLNLAGCLHLDYFDPDVIEDVNLNRTDGAEPGDVAARTLKVDVALRMARRMVLETKARAHPYKWQEKRDELMHADVIVGCLDGFAPRRDLEAFARQHLIPYIDIGMDVHIVEGDRAPSMAGQVMLSVPGGPCLRCYGFLTDEKLAREGTKYGDAGSHPQVGWANGVLGSTAAGIVIDLITGWSRRTSTALYLQYDGNAGTLTPHTRLPHIQSVCTHFSPAGVGPARLRRI